MNDFQGLSQNEIHFRQQKFGKNIIWQRKKPAHLSINLLQDYTFLFLAAVFILSLWSGMSQISGLILGFSFIYCAFVVSLKKKCLQIDQAIQKENYSQVLTIRHGNQQQMIRSDKLVPGDLIYLQSGDVVPADGLIHHCQNLIVDESLLSGSENSQIIKESCENASSAQMQFPSPIHLFAGSRISSGNALLHLTATNAETQISLQKNNLSSQKDDHLPLIISPKIRTAIFLVSLIFAFGSTYLFFQNILTTELYLFALFIILACCPLSIQQILTLSFYQSNQRYQKDRFSIQTYQTAKKISEATQLISDLDETFSTQEYTVTNLTFGDYQISIGGQGFDFKGNIEIYQYQQIILKLTELNPAEIPAKIYQLDKNLFTQLELIATIGHFAHQSQLLATQFKSYLSGSPMSISLLCLSEKLGFTAADIKAKYQLICHPNENSAVVQNVKSGKIYALFQGNAKTIVQSSDEKLQNGKLLIYSREEKQLQLQHFSEQEQQTKIPVGFGIREISAAHLDDWQKLPEHLTYLGFATTVVPPKNDNNHHLKQLQKLGVRNLIFSRHSPEFTQSYLQAFTDSESLPDAHYINYAELDKEKVEEILSNVEFQEKNLIFCNYHPDSQLKLLSSNPDSTINLITNKVLTPSAINAYRDHSNEINTQLVIKDLSLANLVACLRSCKNISPNQQKIPALIYLNSALKITTIPLAFLLYGANIYSAIVLLSLFALETISPHLIQTDQTQLPKVKSKFFALATLTLAIIVLTAIALTSHYALQSPLAITALCCLIACCLACSVTTAILHTPSAPFWQPNFWRNQGLNITHFIFLGAILTPIALPNYFSVNLTASQIPMLFAPLLLLLNPYLFYARKK